MDKAHLLVLLCHLHFSVSGFHSLSVATLMISLKFGRSDDICAYFNKDLAAAHSKTEDKEILGLERASVWSLSPKGKQPTVVPGIPETLKCRTAG